jgi:ribokinase
MLDFLAVGDITTDTFIRLKDAHIHADVNHEESTITMEWGAKIPYDFAVEVNGVGNAANAAVSAARLGLKAGFLSYIGSDANGEADAEVLKREGVDISSVTRIDGPSNHDFVLWFGAERTILVKHTLAPYAVPPALEAPRYMYLSSVGDATGTFHTNLAAWLAMHPETTLAFQPGQELAQGLEPLSALYARTDICVMNKQEAEALLGLAPGTDIKKILEALTNIGPKIALVTDGPDGAYAYDGKQILKVPMYPDLKPPYDRTGAGDAFASAVVAALALGKPLEEALLWGPINSMSVVQKIGAQEGLLKRSEIETFLAQAPAGYKITKL